MVAESRIDHAWLLICQDSLSTTVGVARAACHDAEEIPERKVGATDLAPRSNASAVRSLRAVDSKRSTTRRAKLTMWWAAGSQVSGRPRSQSMGVGDE